MDTNKDGVITIEEFIEACRKVSKCLSLKWPLCYIIWNLHLKPEVESSACSWLNQIVVLQKQDMQYLT